MAKDQMGFSWGTSSRVAKDVVWISMTSLRAQHTPSSPDSVLLDHLDPGCSISPPNGLPCSHQLLSKPGVPSGI